MKFINLYVKNEGWRVDTQITVKIGPYTRTMKASTAAFNYRDEEVAYFCGNYVVLNYYGRLDKDEH